MIDSPIRSCHRPPVNMVKVFARCPAWGASVHLATLVATALMLVHYMLTIAPVVREMAQSGAWLAVCYLTFASILITAYWPSAIYRLIITLGTPLSSRMPFVEFAELPGSALPPVSIVVAVRNEPADMVLSLLRSLLDLDYPDFEIVVADNSDLVVDDDHMNEDFIRILEFCVAQRDRIRFVRRAKDDAKGSEMTVELLSSTQRLKPRGDRDGGKAANLNEAFRSGSRRFEWSVILDADSGISTAALRQLVSIAVGATKSGKKVGFVQSTPIASNHDESLLASTYSVLDDLSYSSYFAVKARVGIASNWGHGVLVSRRAWETTGGFPLEISEDLAWSNELLLIGGFDNYYVPVETNEDKPTSWKALKIQRARWAKGTTIAARKQLIRLWKSNNLSFHEKMDVTHDLTSYFFIATGCFIPLIILPFNLVPEYARDEFFSALVFYFYFVMIVDNLLVPVEIVKLLLRGQRARAWRVLRSLPMISVFSGGIAAQIFSAVSHGLHTRVARFEVTPKRGNHEGNWRDVIVENKFGYCLGLLNGWIAIEALSVIPEIVPLLMLSPISYFLAPWLGSGGQGVDGARVKWRSNTPAHQASSGLLHGNGLVTEPSVGSDDAVIDRSSLVRVQPKRRHFRDSNARQLKTLERLR